MYYKENGGKMNVSLLILILVGYILGSVPNALWIGKVFKGIDVREHGSKNTGSTNAARVLGAKLGILTLILDISKGAIPVILALILKENTDVKLILIGMSAIFGHSFSIFLKFKGGKAVATTLGVFLVLVPKAILIAAIIFFTVFAIWRYVSLSSIAAAASLPFGIWFCYNNVLYMIFGTIIGLLIIIRHRSNIERLKNGEETKFTIKK